MSVKDSIYKSIDDFKAAIYNAKDDPAQSAIDGDIVIVVSPATTTRAATTAAWSRKVKVALQTAAGKRHSWFTGTLPATIADTSSAAAATIHGSATSVSLVNGEGEIQIDGSAAAWLSGTAQVETAVVVGTITTAGNVAVTVTSALLGEAEVISVAVALDDTAAIVGGKIRTALAANENVAANFVVSGADENVILTCKVKAANDSTLCIGYANDNCVGLTDDSTSNNTTAGVAPETNTLTISKNTDHVLMGSVASVTSVETIVE